MTELLQHDPALPQRDVLLDAGAVSRLLERQLVGGGAPPLRVVRAKYRVGESLRVRYRLELAGVVRELACRAFAPGRSEGAYDRALGMTVQDGPLPAVFHVPELDTVFWAFPNDRKLDLLRVARSTLRRRLVAYAPEKSATFRCEPDGREPAYLKVYAADEAPGVARLLARAGGTLGDDHALRLPRVLAASKRMLLVESLAGEPLARLFGRRLIEGYRLLGLAVARLHALPSPADRHADRLDPDRLRAAADVISRARPDEARAAALALEALERRERDAGDPVLLHGDLHPKNALVAAGRLALIDLDQAGTGAAAVDLGSALAALRYAAIVGALVGPTATACARAFLEGYSESRSLPTAEALRWHTSAALLSERALRAVHRVRRPGLQRLGQVLADARTVVDG